ncbi:hypothetical protein PRUPE_7G106800 [Prunus persica]|uniref:EF-hand domain-containing protein n=1 Tax=Prunus persica TaxID=3760 RepID=A0A251N9S4_PRUPE|nr:hypothetical protein PRUPE_7G106800 [Prunus persica]
MEETREAALACFDNLSEEQKDKAWEDFEAMDLDGDGTITLIDYQQFYYGSSYRIPFQQLDTNRDGKLNFQEFKTLFYLLLNSRGTTPLIPTQDQNLPSPINQTLLSPIQGHSAYQRQKWSSPTSKTADSSS